MRQISADEMSLRNMERVVEHPQFAEAKKEENVRLKQKQKQVALEAKNLAKKPATTEVVLPAVTTENLIEEKQEKPKQTKRKFRYKLPARRKLDFNDDKEEYMQTQSTTSSLPAIPTLEGLNSKLILT
ncbi:hypothetical protein AgCh_013487 [Apium graveolens]